MSWVEVFWPGLGKDQCCRTKKSTLAKIFSKKKKKKPVGQGPTELAMDATELAMGGGCLDILLSSISFLFFLILSGRRPDKDCNTVSKGR